MQQNISDGAHPFSNCQMTTTAKSLSSSSNLIKVIVRDNSDSSKVSSIHIDKTNRRIQPIIAAADALEIPITAMLKLYDAKGREVRSPEDMFEGGTYFVEGEYGPFNTARKLT
jgi:hypothetical protein